MCRSTHWPSGRPVYLVDLLVIDRCTKLTKCKPEVLLFSTTTLLELGTINKTKGSSDIEETTRAFKTKIRCQLQKFPLLHWGPGLVHTLGYKHSYHPTNLPLPPPHSLAPPPPPSSSSSYSASSSSLCARIGAQSLQRQQWQNLKWRLIF